MKLSTEVANVEKQKKTCLIVGVFENGQMTATAEEIDKKSQNYISKLLKQSPFSGKIGQILPVFQITHSSYESVFLVGCGKETKLSPFCFRQILINTLKMLATSKVSAATCYLTELNVADKDAAWKVKQIAQALWEGFYCFDVFKSKKEPLAPLKEFIIAIPDSKVQKGCELAAKQGQAIAQGMILAKNLGNMPSNICTPTFLAEQANQLAKSYSSISLKVLGEKDMEKLGMGALLGVAQGSEEEAKLICLEYKGGAKKDRPIALVGKGVTFDTGGNSLKPADSMVGMKYDMCGAASVLGTLSAVAELKLPINIVGVIPAVENMPGGTAYKPEDILVSMSGQTIEVISTDAEGRLILADALTYCERYNPEAVIDIATLTGAVVIALGVHATGLVTNYEPLAKELLKAGEESNDRAWQLPMWEEYQEQIKSPFADMANVGGRPGGTITAGCFLSRFAKKFHWAHLDVAGTAAMMMGGTERYATGRPVPLLTQFLIDRCG